LASVDRSAVRDMHIWCWGFTFLV